MVYVDTSVVLAQLLVEDRLPPTGFWEDELVSSRLLEYETWTVVNREGPDAGLAESTRELLSLVSLVELLPLALERALSPWPTAVKTLDALHLATIEYLRSQRMQVSLATYDGRLVRAAGALGIPTVDLG